MKSNEELIRDAYLTGTAGEKELATRLDLVMLSYNHCSPLVRMLANNGIDTRELLNEALNKAAAYDSLKAALCGLLLHSPQPTRCERPTAPLDHAASAAVGVPVPARPVRRHPYDGDME